MSDIVKTLENDLPNFSIITLTYNRKEFLPLAKYCYLIKFIYFSVCI